MSTADSLDPSLVVEGIGQVVLGTRLIVAILALLVYDIGAFLLRCFSLLFDWGSVTSLDKEARYFWVRALIPLTYMSLPSS